MLIKAKRKNYIAHRTSFFFLTQIKWKYIMDIVDSSFGTLAPKYVSYVMIPHLTPHYNFFFFNFIQIILKEQIYFKTPKILSLTSCKQALLLTDEILWNFMEVLSLSFIGQRNFNFIFFVSRNIEDVFFFFEEFFYLRFFFWVCFTGIKISTLIFTGRKNLNIFIIIKRG